MPLDKDSIRLALAEVVSPDAVAKIAYCDGHASIRVAAAGLDDAQRGALSERIRAAVRAQAAKTSTELTDVHVEITDDAPARAAAPRTSPALDQPERSKTPAPADPLPAVRHIIAVGAGKGGVGKSTIAVNLAVGLARRGHAVGLMDGDIYGPSLPTLLGLGAFEPVIREGLIQPFLVHGVKAMTIGKLVEPEKPLVWRGPMAHGAFKQLVEQTNWGELDYLIIDLPPGTGDISLTMAQMLRLTGAVIVCTPQKVAQDDAVRAAGMFKSLGVEVLGVVENMSTFIADDIPAAQGGPREYDLFGKGGAQRMAQRLGLPFLGAVPLTISLRVNSDAGNASANFDPRSRLSADLERLVANLEAQVSLASVRLGRTTPTLTVS